MFRRLWAIVVFLVLVAMLTPPAWGASGARAPGLTFLVAGDSHFGAQGMVEKNRLQVEQMNTLPGRRWPGEVGGVVGQPLGLLMLGDMTDWGQPVQWEAFVEAYGLTGRDGLLKYPVFEIIGNHDLVPGNPVDAAIRKRHGEHWYAWNWGDLRLIALGLYPSDKVLPFLGRELEALGKERPAILFFHYAIEGPFSGDWTPEEKDAFARTIEGHNILAIFHGHYHMPTHYQWRGIDIFRPGSPRHGADTFMVVRVQNKRLTVGTWHFGRQQWLDKAFVKPVK